MENTFWFKQSADSPLFPNLIWSKPENKNHAGKLLIVGGNSGGFSAVGSAFSAAQKAGAGSIRVILPDKLRSKLQKIIPEAEFAPSTISGSFAKKALAELIDAATWADGVLLAGDFGRNSETAILIDKFISKFSGQLVVCDDALDYFFHENSPFFNRKNVTAVINLGKMQKLAKHNKPSTPILHDMNLKEIVEILHQWTVDSSVNIVNKHMDHLIVASGGKVCTMESKKEDWQIAVGAYLSVWLIQQPKDRFESLATAVFEYIS